MLTLPAEYDDKTRRSITIMLIASALLHVASIFIFGRPPHQSGSSIDMQQVTFMDVTYRPEVAKIMPKGSFGGGGGGGGGDQSAATYASGVASDNVPSIDMSATLNRDQSQAKIDLDRYQMDRGSGMDVIRIGGSGSNKSTDEILAQPKIELTRGPGSGPGSGGPGLPGMRGYPGVPQPQAEITIERRPLSTPAARELPSVPTQELPKVEAAVSNGNSFMVAGPISQREIAKKVIPRYPKWALDRRISGTVVVSIWVEPNGQVKGVPSVESSSGYPELDQVVVDALRSWEFAPLGANVKSEDQWGVITFRFTLS